MTNREVQCVESVKHGVRPGGWSKLKDYVIQSWNDGCCQWTLWLYFVICIGCFGSLGLWESLVVGSHKIAISETLLSLNTIAPPLAVSVCWDLVRSKNDRCFQMPAIAIVFLVFLLNGIAVFVVDSSCWTYIFTIVSLCISYFIWWIVNAQNPNFWDNEIESGTGGSTTYRPSQSETLGVDLNMEGAANG